MAEYIFPAFIFITSLFLCWLIINPSGRFMGLICMVLAGFVTYLVMIAAQSSPENSTAILSITFSIELILMITIAFVQKNDLNIKALSILYSVGILIAFFSGRGCYNEDEKSRARQANRENEIAIYKSQYDFNIDSLILTRDKKDNSVKGRINLAPPFIVYRKQNGKTDFDYEFNKSLKRSLTSFTLDSIRTIILLENSVVDLGTYTNGKTRAQKIATSISFIDRSTMNTVTSITLTGGNPPSSITYRRSSPESRSGSAPSKDEILEVIKKELVQIKK